MQFLNTFNLDLMVDFTKDSAKVDAVDNSRLPNDQC